MGNYYCRADKQVVMGDVDPEKSTRRRQWQERPDKPIAVRSMTKREIDEYKNALVMSYKCKPGDVEVEVQRIFDENDEDRDDCVLIIYKLRCLREGEIKYREIRTLKMPVPDNIRQKAEELLRNRMMKRGRRTANPSLNPGASSQHVERATGTAPNQQIQPVPRVNRIKRVGGV